MGKKIHTVPLKGTSETTYDSWYIAVIHCFPRLWSCRQKPWQANYASRCVLFIKVFLLFLSSNSHLIQIILEEIVQKFSIQLFVKR